MDLLRILAKNGTIPESDISEIRRQSQSADESLEEVLAKRGVSSEEILQAKGEYYGVPVRHVKGTNIPYETLKLIPDKSMEHYKIVPLAVNDGVLEVGFVEPENMEARDAVQFIASKHDMPFKMFLISQEGFESVRGGEEAGLSGEVSGALTDLQTELTQEEKAVSESIEKLSESGKSDDGDDGEGGANIIADAPVTKIVATILRYATEGGASDVHIEPIADNVRVRFRVDGTLHTSLKLPKNVLSAVVARIKILSHMKLDEKRKPQDGRFSAYINERKIDFRVSTFPTYYGEKVVMRILDPESGLIPLDDLGLTERNLELLHDAVSRPYGIVLVSGPTGSGKTTTLYSMLREIDTEKKNVLSLEDPVEYNISGVNQSQVRPEIGYTFSNGLRTALRQDPDVIMVGEIRDKETAQLAIQAALTGHLVFSTIHTNSAIGVIPRLVDMGIDPYLIAPTLTLAVAQRLVKTLCPGSGKPMPVEGSIKAMIESEFEDLPEEYRSKIEIPDQVYSPQATEDCPSGVRGRTAVMEILNVDREIEEVILNDPVDTAIYDKARKKGMLTMKEDAMLKAFKSEIPFEEVSKL